jgi:hypothetical protein
MGNFYIYCQSDFSANCAAAQYGAAGGTSFGAPIFAGIMALLNQQTNTTEGQGNANYVLYKLASQQTASACNSASGSGTSCVFNDVTSGTIAMPCVAGSAKCNVATAGHAFGILAGYGTGTGYDLATGLGSLNVANLLAKWSSVAFRPSMTMLGLSPTSSLTHGQSVTVTANVAPSSGSGTPIGRVSLLTSTGVAVDGFTLSNGAVSGTTNLLPGGSYTVTAHYAGDPIFGGSESAPISVTVGKENSSTQLNLVTFDWNGREVSSNASGAVYGSPYILRMNVLNGAGGACSPNPIGESSCPTGNLTLTDNGNALDGGTFGLNSLGYAEDQPIQLSGGNQIVKATYPGDNSFNASSVTTTYNITAASTSVSAPTFCCGGTVGGTFSTNVAVQAQSFGAAPGGTVNFLANGNPITGTVSYQQTPGSGSNPIATLNAFFTSSNSAFTAAGNYTITASYSGDANYASSVSTGTKLSVKYPAPLLSVGPTSQTVVAGGSVTVSAFVDTSMKTAPVPTGTVPFIYWGPMSAVSGTETYTTTTDSNGNVELQASITFVPVANVSIAASYNGDSNYPAAGGGGLSDIIVTGSDFVLLPSLSSVPAIPGESGFVQIYIQGQSNYSGTVNFSSASCAGLPKESTCNFSPATVTGVGSTGLTVNTTAPHALAKNSEGMRNELWAASFSMPLAALVLIGAPYRRNLRKLLLAALLSVLLIGLGCGGGSGGGGGGGSGDPGTPPGSYAITVTGTSGSGSTALTHTTTFTLVVQ